MDASSWAIIASILGGAYAIFLLIAVYNIWKLLEKLVEK